MKKPRQSISLSDNQKLRLAQEASHLGVSVSEVLRRILDIHYGRMSSPVHGSKPDERKRVNRQ